MALFSLTPALSHKLKEGDIPKVKRIQGLGCLTHLLDRDNNGCILYKCVVLRALL